MACGEGIPVDCRRKRDVIAAWARGRLGNRPRTWPTLADWEESGFAGAVSIRCRVPNSPFCRYHLAPGDVRAAWAAFEAAGARGPDLYVTEMMPDAEIAVQGEACRMPGGLYLHYSTEPVPMRPALRDHGRQAWGSAARAVLAHALDPASLDDLDALLDEFDGAVVEFSAYRKCVGQAPGRNTVFWEARRY